MTATPVRAVSPLAGLRRRSLGDVEVLAQSVAVTAPSAAVAATPALVAATAGLGTVYSYLIAVGVIAMVTVCVRQFSRRLAAPGSLYTFVARGLGPRPALVAGAGLAVGYAVLSMAATVLAAWYGLSLLARLGVPGTGSRAATVVAVAVLGLLVTRCLVRGIGVSSRVALAVESVAVVLIAGILLAVLTGAVGAGTGRPALGLGAIVAAQRRGDAATRRRGDAAQYAPSRLGDPGAAPSITTVCRARSMRPRGSRITGRNEPSRSLEIRSCTSRHRGLQPRAGPIALSDAGPAALIRRSADVLGRLGLDQILQDELDRLVDQVHAVTGAERLEPKMIP